MTQKGIKVPQATYDRIQALRDELAERGLQVLPAPITSDIHGISLGSVVEMGVRSLEYYARGAYFTDKGVAK